MREWSYFFPDVLPSVLGCPEPTVERHLMRAAQNFFSRTKVWRTVMDPILTVADTDTYDLNRPLQAELVKATRATLNGLHIGFETAESMTLEYQQRANSSRRLLIVARRQVVVWPTQAADVPIVIEGIFQPSDKAIGISNDALAEQYSEAIAARAIATLKTADDKDPWYGPAAAEVKGKLYEREVGNAAKAAWKSYSSENPRSAPQFF